MVAFSPDRASSVASDPVGQPEPVVTLPVTVKEPEELTYCSMTPQENSARVGRGAERSEGSVWSVLVRLPEAPWILALSADAAKAMQVEIADTGFHLLPDFSGKHSGRTQTAGGLDCPVSWPKGRLATLQGKIVRFHISLTKSADADPRLYAVYIRSQGRQP